MSNEANILKLIIQDLEKRKAFIETQNEAPSQKGFKQYNEGRIIQLEEIIEDINEMKFDVENGAMEDMLKGLKNGKGELTMTKELIEKIANGEEPCPECGVQHLGVTMLENGRCQECMLEFSEPVSGE